MDGSVSLLAAGSHGWNLKVLLHPAGFAIQGHHSSVYQRVNLWLNCATRSSTAGCFLRLLWPSHVSPPLLAGIPDFRTPYGTECGRLRASYSTHLCLHLRPRYPSPRRSFVTRPVVSPQEPTSRITKSLLRVRPKLPQLLVPHRFQIGCPTSFVFHKFPNVHGPASTWCRFTRRAFRRCMRPSRG